MTEYMIYDSINRLILYACERGLIQPSDAIFIRNSLLDKMKLREYTEPETAVTSGAALEDILSALSSNAVERGLIEDTQMSRGNFETELTGVFTPLPSKIIDEFWRCYKITPVSATDFFYNLCQDVNYLNRSRTARDIKWHYDTEYGRFEITINLSKPEKDPRDIAKAVSAQKSAYPACLLCPENMGFAGSETHPARQNLRFIPISLNGENWGFQYSPYVYYNEHCIAFCCEHRPMLINREKFGQLFSFLKLFPHYFIGSNAGLPVVGGSILSHEHLQGGRHDFAMDSAKPELKVKLRGFDDVDAACLKWPMPVIRVSHSDRKRLTDAADFILSVWSGYSDGLAQIFAYTDNNTAHNTLTAIARYKEGRFELDLVPRNNLTTPEYPFGLFHPHEELHHIKKENIGLIEVMGLAVLPARLYTEMRALKRAVLSGKDPASDPQCSMHSAWYRDISAGHTVTAENIDSILREGIGAAFLKVLSHAAVFKRTPEGRAALSRFLSALS